MIKKCTICGKEFTNSYRKYCSDKCSKEGQRIKALNLFETKRKLDEKNGLKKTALRDTARAAREAGMSYGQYVALQNQSASFRREKKRLDKPTRTEERKEELSI